MNNSVIIIPFYKDQLTENEEVSLRQCFKVLSNYPIIAIKPNSLDLTFITEDLPFTDVVSFDDFYFKSVNGYNQLMLSSLFYRTFLEYKYMLIYQLDAFVFSDQLQYWCDQNYDYIGAPWLRPFEHKNTIEKFILHIKSWFYRRYNVHRSGVPNAKQLIKSVGNGGFSLRRIAKFHELCLKFQGLAESYISHRESEFNEDIFWSIAINRKERNLNIPCYKTALGFSIETFPELAFKLNHNRLPFGCHAWDKHLDFWKLKLKRYGYLFDA